MIKTDGFKVFRRRALTTRRIDAIIEAKSHRMGAYTGILGAGEADGMKSWNIIRDSVHSQVPAGSLCSQPRG